MRVFHVTLTVGEGEERAQLATTMHVDFFAHTVRFVATSTKAECLALEFCDLRDVVMQSDDRYTFNIQHPQHSSIDLTPLSSVLDPQQPPRYSMLWMDSEKKRQYCRTWIEGEAGRVDRRMDVVMGANMLMCAMEEGGELKREERRERRRNKTTKQEKSETRTEEQKEQDALAAQAGASWLKAYCSFRADPRQPLITHYFLNPRQKNVILQTQRNGDVVTRQHAWRSWRSLVERWRDGDACDILLVCREDDQKPTRIACHRVVLTTHFPYFAAMFNNRFQENKQVEVSLSLPGPLMYSLVSWAYTGRLEVSVDSAAQLLQAVDMLCHGELIDCVSAWLLSNLSPVSAPSVWAVASRAGWTEMSKHAATVAATHIETLLTLPSLSSWSVSFVEAVLCAGEEEGRQADTRDLWTIIRQWVNDQTDRQRHLCTLISLLPVNCPIHILHIISRDSLVCTDQRCVQYFEKVQSLRCSGQSPQDARLLALPLLGEEAVQLEETRGMKRPFAVFSAVPVACKRVKKEQGE